MDNLINQMENAKLHCEKTKFYNLNKFHQPLLDDYVTIENLGDLLNLYQN